MLHVYASGSRGNVSVVSDGRTRIMLECGLPMRSICALVPELGEIDTCLITHAHKDHSRAAEGLIKRGVTLYAPEGAGIRGAQGLEFMQPIMLGTLRVTAMEAIHDVICAAYVIDSVITGERLLYATDTQFLRRRVPGMTEIGLECNYSEELMAASELSAVVRDRIATTHMSIERALEFLKVNDLSRVKSIQLLHLSPERADAEEFRARVAAATGKVVTVGGQEMLGKRE